MGKSSGNPFSANFDINSLLFETYNRYFFFIKYGFLNFGVDYFIYQIKA